MKSIDPIFQCEVGQVQVDEAAPSTAHELDTARYAVDLDGAQDGGAFLGPPACERLADAKYASRATVHSQATRSIPPPRLLTPQSFSPPPGWQVLGPQVGGVRAVL